MTNKKMIKNPIKPGDSFGRLTVIVRISMPRTIGWSCSCECGRQVFVLSSNLLSGRTTSCGCSRRCKDDSMIVSIQKLFTKIKEHASCHGVSISDNEAALSYLSDFIKKHSQ